MLINQAKAVCSLLGCIMIMMYGLIIIMLAFFISQEAYGYNGIPGCKEVDALAEYLVTRTDLSPSRGELYHIIELYTKLHDFAKKPLQYNPQYQKRTTGGRFGRLKSQGGHVNMYIMKKEVHPNNLIRWH